MTYVQQTDCWPKPIRASFVGDYSRENIEMSLRASSFLKFSIAAVVACFVSTSSIRADVIDIDLSAADPSAVPAIKAAEAIWEARIQAYSTELPKGIRDQLGSLYISFTVAPIDGVGGILAQAGPDSFITFENGQPLQQGQNPSSRIHSVVVRASMTFDLDDLASLSANGILVSTIAHEMGHAMGFGTLFQPNLLADARGGFGQIEYINGEYAIQGYRKDISNPVATFVPLEQRGGPGTALGHWIDAPPFFNQVFTGAFKKEVMTGFAGDFDPTTGQVVFAPTFISEATFGAFADLGFAVDGINGAFAAPKGAGTGRWPKSVGGGVNPFEVNGVPAAAGLNFSLSSIKAVTLESLGSTGSGAGEVETEALEDPYSLRKHRWVK